MIKIVIGLIIAVYAVFVIVKKIRDFKKGKYCSCCDCGCGHCVKKEEKHN